MNRVALLAWSLLTKQLKANFCTVTICIGLLLVWPFHLISFMLRNARSALGPSYISYKAITAYNRRPKNTIFQINNDLIKINPKNSNLYKRRSHLSLHVHIVISLVVPDERDSVIVALWSLLADGDDGDDPVAVEAHRLDSAHQLAGYTKGHGWRLLEYKLTVTDCW